jgi:hypothetical protein
MIKLEDLGLTPATEPLEHTHAVDYFPYEGYFGHPASCKFDVYENDTRRVVIVTEVAQNPGTSVTNRIEVVAETADGAIGKGHLFGNYGTPDKPTVLIEHYDNNSYSTGRGSEDFSVVRFETENTWCQSPRACRYANPSWYHLDKAEVERLLGQKW